MKITPKERMIILNYDKFIENSNVNDFSLDYYNAKAVHCIHLHQGIEKKVKFALIKKEAVKNILDYKSGVVNDWKQDLIKNKQASNFPSEEFEYLNIDISSELTLEMLVNEFFSHIHSLFDLIAFLINETLLECSIKNIQRVSYNNVVRELENNKRYPKLLAILKEVNDNDWYKYIDDFNNLAKHRYLTDINSISYLDTGEIKVNISEIERKERHEEGEAFDIIYICFDEVLIFLNKVFMYIKQELPNINFENRYNRDSLYYKAQLSFEPGTSGANAFLITGSKTYGEDDELFINLSTIDDDTSKVKLINRNNLRCVFLKHNLEDDIPYAYAELEPEYKLRTRYDYTKYKVKTSNEIKMEMAIDFFKPKTIYGDRIIENTILIVNDK